MLYIVIGYRLDVIDWMLSIGCYRLDATVGGQILLLKDATDITVHIKWNDSMIFVVAWKVNIFSNKFVKLINCYGVISF